MTWIQTNLPDHNRVFLWAQTNVQKYDSNRTTDPIPHRYQEYQANGGRGILVVNPATGDFWVPAVLDYSVDHGHQFGAESNMSLSNSNDGITSFSATRFAGIFRPARGRPTSFALSASF